MIDKITISRFESALPVDKHTNAPLWTALGLQGGEYCYRIAIDEKTAIFIRSSINASGISAATGKDSIRAWLIDVNGKPLGSKVAKWITRQPGWEKRLTDTLRTLWRWRKSAGDCKVCKTPLGIFKVTAQTESRGRIFASCKNKNHPKLVKSFKWIEEK